MAQTRPSSTTIRFGDFELDNVTGEVYCRGERVKLAPQPSTVLVLLAERAGELVTREELRQRVWGSDTYVDFEQGLNFSIRQIRTALGDDPNHPQFIETVPRRGYRFIAKAQKNATEHDNAIAVLPFENKTGDPGSQFLVDGLTESIIYRLTRIPELRVIPRSTVFRYGLADKEPHEIGQELQVRAVVIGRVLQAGDDLILTIELLDVTHRREMWGQRYRKKLIDVFELQENIANEVCDKLRLELSTSARHQMQKRDTEDLEAYRLYLRGRFFWNKRTERAINKSLAYFNEAIERDPGYALAYAGLADAYIPLGYYTYLAPGDAFPKAKSAAARALEIDDSLAEAHGVLGNVAWLYDWDWAAAELELHAALDLQPNVPRLHQVYAEYLTSQGAFDQAHEEMRRALELDALSLPLNYIAGLPHYFGRNYQEASDCCCKALELDPNFYPARYLLGLAYLQQQQFTDALDQLEHARELSLGAPFVAGALGAAYGLAGRVDEARTILEELEHAKNQRYVSPYVLGTVFIGLNQPERALGALENAFSVRCCRMVWLTHDPLWDTARDSARFRAVMSRMGFPH